MSLLETNKPFLVNPLRLPALPTLLLFSSSIETNSDLTHLVFDSWIEVQSLPMNQTDVELCVRTGIRIRTSWTRLLDYQLKKENSRDVGLLEAALTTDLVLFMSPLSSATHFGYSLKRLLPADMKTIYRGRSSMDSELEDMGSNPFVSDYQMSRDETLGGVRVAPYLVYDCLADGGSLVLFSCPGCNLDLQLTTLEKLQHLQHCAPESDSPEDNTAASQLIQGDHKNSSSYFCDICNKGYPHFNSVAILKHKKSHSSIVMPS
uniref:Probable ATP-dependent RNA helicase DHX34 n=2 Tax=Cacopsylla melanoneura TaxID=428564 RepID=A0A8D8W9Q0_9HEMI